MSGGVNPDMVLFVLILLAALASNLYAFFYMFRPWFRTPQGRALMLKSWGNAILLNMAAAYTIWGEYEGRHVVRLVGFSIFLAGIVYLLVTLLFSPGSRHYPPWNWSPRRMRTETDADPRP